MRPCRNRWVVEFFRARHPGIRRQAQACICEQGAISGCHRNGTSRTDKEAPPSTGHFPRSASGKNLRFPPDHFKLGNGTHVPDVQSLLLLSVAFDISIDELIKGDVETMEESVRKADHSLIWMYAAEMLLTVIAIVALFFALDSFIEKNTTSGFACLLVFAATFATALGLSFAVKKTKDRNNILTYQEILAFCAGEEPTAPRDTMPSYAT